MLVTSFNIRPVVLGSKNFQPLRQLPAMNFFSSTRAALRYRSLVISALLQLTEIVDTSDTIFSTNSKILGIYETLPVYCDRKYRSKYGHPDSYETSVATVKLVPQTGPSEEIDWDPEDEENQPVDPWMLSKVGYDSEFLSTEDKNPEFLTHDNDDSTEFIEDRGELRSFGRNLAPLGPFLWNITFANEVYDLEDAGRRYPLSSRGEEIGNNKRYMVRRTRVTFVDDSSSLAKKLNSFHRHRKPNRKFDRADTFRSIFDGRRDASGQPDDNLHRAVWSEDNCKSHRRIVGGYAVESPEELPYMAFVDTGCGGAIVSDAWVLTAAHCVDEDDPKYVHVGSIDLLGGCQYSVVEVYPHPRFTRDDLEYDIALLKTAPSFVFSLAVKPIRMSFSKVRRKTCGVVAGWGADSYKGSARNKLMMTMIPVVGRRRCHMFGIKQGQFCAGYRDASSDACQGDSGGPFVVNGILVGVVSFGYKCATPNIPGVYVDISYHRKWIRSIAGI